MTTSTAPVPTAARTRLPGLRALLRLDVAVTGANAVAYLAAAAPLSDALGLPVGLLRGAGAFLLVYAAAVWLVAARPRIHPGAAAAVVAVNALWALDCLTAALLGWGTPTTAGVVWTVLQALVVAAFAAAQLAALRRR
ncbi:hypothetical protein [Kineococcus glutinatus]|uniref:Integral membrane protein n=1 Tax=Kineococcus glutinatus TaxID=1070872 RepID=A0ABP9I4T4_9ACTN